MTTPAVQTSTEAVNSLALLGKVSVVLILTILVILACAWMFKRFGQGYSGQQQIPMRVLSVLNVGPKEKVVVVQVDDQRLILGVAPGSVTALSELSPANPEEIQQTRSAPPSPFARLLKSRQEGKSSS
ncbi:flagellar biosynthetic protein FliO [Aliidiomarina halalkaliphila]|uniref:Flagellar protein n=1 Tax=Aliidiomarina halalkaliphila TaxID=2593535 RepID=A0A552X1I9_9GAMM|nr:flagellar biosynthetic protein FliO [Aliidiomarina halalkaliphila]TRW48816.1 flagellar biosynthetic protein FliO [Aliidiomarina halalkaliphila]